MEIGRNNPKWKICNICKPVESLSTLILAYVEIMPVAITTEITWMVGNLFREQPGDKVDPVFEAS